MSNNPFPSGVWVRQPLGGNQVKIIFIPSRRKSSLTFESYDKLENNGRKDKVWKEAFEKEPAVDIDKGQIILRISADQKLAHLVWLPDDKGKQPVEVTRQVRQEGALGIGEAAGPVTYAACVATAAVPLTPAGAMVACSPLLLVPGP